MQIRPKMLAMKRQLHDKYQQLEKEYYQLNKSLAKKKPLTNTDMANKTVQSVHVYTLINKQIKSAM